MLMIIINALTFLFTDVRLENIEVKVCCIESKPTAAAYPPSDYFGAAYSSAPSDYSAAAAYW